ncbi:hypothetical protein GXW74_12105 [Roseomonas eburnea]|uniref:Uncharacterized protein n=1 Tax=Neoroseomonas eburnea TaxID=1346889 RepID=A0A9X9XBZ3_9PROT|nr:hypothetical protein [Neoroseomonas eburnea]MBR0681229.1 hypothetical protein [Neoroseomonas eburnea]
MRGPALHLCAVAAVALGLLSGVSPAAAQGVCPGRVSANAFAPIPRDAAIAVPNRTQTESERRLRGAVLAALANVNRRVADNAPFVLSWRGGISVEGDNFGGFGDTMQDRTFRESDDLSWTSDVPRMGGRRIPTLRVSGVVELRERASGRVVWTAVLSCQRHGTDDEALFSHLATAVAPLIGQSAAGRPF